MADEDFVPLLSRALLCLWPFSPTDGRLILEIHANNYL